MWFTYVLQGLGLAQNLGLGGESPTYTQQAPQQKKDYSILVIVVIVILLSLVAYKVLK